MIRAVLDMETIPGHFQVLAVQVKVGKYRRKLGDRAPLHLHNGIGKTNIGKTYTKADGE